jgi:hypothetical protein
MKSNKLAKLLALAAMLTLSVSAFAGSANFTIISDSSIGGKTVKAGDYKATWSESGEIKILQGKKEIATVQGKIVERAEAAPRTAVVKKADTSGVGIITEIRLSGKKTVLVLEDSGAQVAKGN